MRKNMFESSRLLIFLVSVSFAVGCGDGTPLKTPIKENEKTEVPRDRFTLFSKQPWCVTHSQQQTRIEFKIDGSYSNITYMWNGADRGVEIARADGTWQVARGEDTVILLIDGTMYRYPFQFVTNENPKLNQLHLKEVNGSFSHYYPCR